MYRCLISNFNYGHFLRQAVDSVLSQTIIVSDILIINDGSNDHSQIIIDELIRLYPDRVRGISQANAGQLSTFNRFVPYVDDTDIVFLLDADDLYPIDYCASVVEVFQKSKADVIFSRAEKFSGTPVTNLSPNRNESWKILPSTPAIANLVRPYVGAPTSGIATTGSAFRSIFPCPLERDWKIRADDVIVYASNLLNLVRTISEGTYFYYRVHENNNTFNKTIDKLSQKRHQQAVTRLHEWYISQYALPNPPSFSDTAHELAKLKNGWQDLYKIHPPRRVYRRLMRKWIKKFFKDFKWT